MNRRLPLKERCLGSNAYVAVLGRLVRRGCGTGEIAGIMLCGIGVSRDEVGNLSESAPGPDVPASKIQISDGMSFASKLLDIAKFGDVQYAGNEIGRNGSPVPRRLEWWWCNCQCFPGRFRHKHKNLLGLVLG